MPRLFNIDNDGTLREVANSAVNKDGVCVIPEGVKHISGSVFFENYKLKKIVLPESLISIGPRAISRTSIEELVIPDNVKIIYENAFTKNPNLKSVVIGKSTQMIGPYAFSDCINIEYLIFKGSADFVSTTAFFNCDGIEVVSIQPNTHLEIRADRPLNQNLTINNVPYPEYERSQPQTVLNGVLGETFPDFEYKLCFGYTYPIEQVFIRAYHNALLDQEKNLTNPTEKSAD